MIMTEIERQQLTTTPGDAAIAALANDDVERAVHIARSSINAHFTVRDIYTQWNGLTVSHIEENFGGEALDECLLDALTTVLRPWIEWFRNGLSREAVSQFAQICRMDAGHIDDIEETNDTIVFHLTGWMGARWEALPGAGEFARVNNAIQRLCIDWLGYTPFVLQWEPGAKKTLVTFYKDPQQVPDEVFERMGLSADRGRIAAAFSVAGGLLFNADERNVMKYQSYTLAAEALDSGDIELAKRHLLLSKTEWYLAHHFMRDWVTGMTTWLHRQHGDGAVWRCVDECYNRPTMGAMLDALKQVDVKAQVHLLAGIFHQHGMKFKLIETEEGVEFKTAPCGSGGRLIDELAYAPPKQFSTVSGPSVASFGLEKMPVYCMHCPGTNKLILEGDGPYFALVEPDITPDGQLRGHCSFLIYHQRQSVPDDMYRRVGMVPPVEEKAITILD